MSEFYELLDVATRVAKRYGARVMFTENVYDWANKSMQIRIRHSGHPIDFGTSVWYRNMIVGALDPVIDEVLMKLKTLLVLDELADV
ncbi:MAG: hypothetical protein AB7L09_01675 [Nitrospira sp.]